MFINISLNLQSTDWGLANLNPMVKAFGLKKDRKAKCKSCYFFKSNSCAFLFPELNHNQNYHACLKYQNKKIRSDF